MAQGVEKTYHALNLALGVIIGTLLVIVGGMWTYENAASLKKARDQWFESSVKADPKIQFNIPTSPYGQDLVKWNTDQQAQLRKTLDAMMQQNQDIRRQVNSIQQPPPRFGR
jgi:hypothetical protein